MLVVVAVVKDGLVDDRVVVEEGFGQSRHVSLIFSSFTKSSVEFPNSSTSSRVSRY